MDGCLLKYFISYGEFAKNGIVGFNLSHAVKKRFIMSPVMYDSKSLHLLPLASVNRKEKKTSLL